MESPLAAHGAERRGCPRWPSLEAALCSGRGEARVAEATQACQPGNTRNYEDRNAADPPQGSNPEASVSFKSKAD